MKIVKIATPALLLASLSACQSMPGGKTAANRDETHPALAFAQGACSGCHGVERFDLSPNQDAPPFTAIANRDGVSAASLRAWLRNAHNYPQEMDFDLDSPQVDALVEYILTLKDPAYKPTVG